MKAFTVKDIYSHEQLTEHVIVIRESYSWDHRFPIGLIIGTEKAAVIDSGLGCAGDGLRKYCEKLTEKPLVNYLTHVHPDHGAGSVTFDEAYCTAEELPDVERALNNAKRLRDLVSYSKNNPEILAYGKENNLDCDNAVFKMVKDGDTIDLGGIQIEAIAVPGHSPGHLAYYVRSEKVVFVGDALMKRAFLRGRTLLEPYIQTLREFRKKLDDDVILVPGHQQDYVFEGLPDVSLIDDTICGIEEILAGMTKDDVYYPPFFKDRENKEAIYVHQCGTAFIKYDKNQM